MGFWRDVWNGTETKTTVSAPINLTMPSSYQPFLNPAEITPWMAWQLFKNVSTFAKVANLIADEVANMQPAVRVNGAAVEDHPLLSFLMRPGFNRTRERLVKELAIQYLVTGTAYPVIFGNVAIKGPGSIIAIDVMKAQYVNPVQGLDMWPSEYWYAEGTRAQTFTRAGNPRDFRWIDGNGLSEIVPFYDMDGDRRGVGLSKLNAVKYDVELRIKGIQHNAALLDNGARLSGVLSFKGDLTEDQKNDLHSQFKQGAQGAANAGKVLLTSAGESDFTALSQNMRDMDFTKLVEIVEDAIVAAYSVPVTLFRTSAQTNNNYEVAWRMFYNLAVKPCFKVIYAGLGQIFSERLGEDIEIVPDELSNPILAAQALERSTKLSDHHLISRNEARDIIGMEPVLGGDTIYGSISDVAQAEDYFTNHGINDPSEQDNSQQAFHQVRPEANPVVQAGAEAEARAAGRAAGTPEPDKQPDKEVAAGKPQASEKPEKKPDKKPAKKPAKDKKSEDAFGVLIDFAERLEAKGGKGKRKAPALVAAE
jgi:HK97 family phage portal protein